jgi:hypothetical protein
LTLFDLLFVSPPIRNELRKLIDAMDRSNVGYDIPSSPALRKFFYRILDQITDSLNGFIFIFICTSDLSPFYVASSICTVNSAKSRNLTLIPRQPRPVQGKRPEVQSEDLDPSSRNAASGLLSHQHLEIPPYDLILLTCHFWTFLLSFFTHFALYGLGPRPIFYLHHSLDR